MAVARLREAGWASEENVNGLHIRTQPHAAFLQTFLDGRVELDPRTLFYLCFAVGCSYVVLQGWDGRLGWCFDATFCISLPTFLPPDQSAILDGLGA